MLLTMKKISLKEGQMWQNGLEIYVVRHIDKQVLVTKLEEKATAIFSNKELEDYLSRFKFDLIGKFTEK